MRAFPAAATLALLFVVSVSASVTAPGLVIEPTETVMHGGGSRKSSPPGQCCHLETRTGVVHCH